MKKDDLKFSEKDKIKYLSEAFRNIGIALIAGSVLGLMAIEQVSLIPAVVTLFVGCVTIWLGYKMMELLQ